MNKTKRIILITVIAAVAVIGIVLAIVLPLTLNKDAYYKVTFESNGGTAVESLTNVPHGSLITEPTEPTKFGYTFDGWFKDVKLTREWKFAADKVTSDIILYAKWNYNATNGLEMVLNGSEYTVLGIGSASGEELIIPDTYNGLPVTTIATGAFRNEQSVKTVFVPSSVKTILSEAFSNCGNLESVILPDSITVIENRTFFGCSKLASVNIPSAVTEIKEQAFSGCRKLTEVNLPASLRKLGENVFSNCIGIEKLSVSSSNPYFYSRFNERDYNCIVEITSQEGKTVNKLVVGCKETEIPSNVTVIGQGAFYGCSTLTRIAIPSRVEKIEEGAFNACGLTYVNIPASVTEIGERAFSNCEYLETVSFGVKENGEHGIEILGRAAFSYCYLLKPFNLYSSLTFVGRGLFCDCDLNTVYYEGDVNYFIAQILEAPNEENAIYTGEVRVSGNNGSELIVAGLA